MKKELKILIVVLGICLLLTLGIGVGYYITTKDANKSSDVENKNDNSQVKDNKIEDREKLTADDVKSLNDILTLAYSLTEFGSGEFTTIYSNKKMMFENLEEEYKNAMTWEILSPIQAMGKYSKINEASKKDINKYSDIEDFIGYELMKIGEPSYGFATDIYDTNYNEINATYKKLFGQDKNVKMEDARFNGNSCYVRNNDLLCTADIIGGYDFSISTRFIDAYKEDDTIVIYNYYLNAGDELVDFDAMSDAEFKNYAKKYKSVFKEDYNGNYYWYSTEPVEE